MTKSAAEIKKRYRCSKWSIYAFDGWVEWRLSQPSHFSLSQYDCVCERLCWWLDAGTGVSYVNYTLSKYSARSSTSSSSSSSVSGCQLHDVDTNGINWSTKYLHGLFPCKIQQCHLWQTDKRADSTFADWLIDWKFTLLATTAFQVVKSNRKIHNVKVAHTATKI